MSVDVEVEIKSSAITYCMQLSRLMAGYSAGEAEKFRKAIGKKKEEIMRPALNELRARLIAKGHSEEIAQKVVELIEPFVGYGLTKKLETPALTH